MSPIIQYVRRSNVTGTVALIFAVTIALMALIACVAATLGNVAAAKEIKDTIPLLIGVVGALLASPTPHGRATDPAPATAIDPETRP